MEAYSNYYIKCKNTPDTVMIVTDQNPTGVTITMKNNSPNGGQESLSLPRTEMIEALEYLLEKIKAGRS